MVLNPPSMLEIEVFGIIGLMSQVFLLLGFKLGLGYSLATGCRKTDGAG